MKQITLTATQTTFKDLEFGDQFIFMFRPGNEITASDILFQKINYKVDDDYYHATGSSVLFDVPYKDIVVLKIT